MLLTNTFTQKVGNNPGEDKKAAKGFGLNTVEELAGLSKVNQGFCRDRQTDLMQEAAKAAPRPATREKSFHKAF